MKNTWFSALLLLLSRLAIAQHTDAIPLSAAKFATGDNVRWSAPDFDDAPWKMLATGRVWQEQGYPGYHGFAWYRLHLVIPAALRKKAHWGDSLRIFLAHVNDVDETWLNGARIGKTGAFPEDPGGYISRWPAVREYHVSAASPAIHWDGDNVIAIRVYDGGGTGGIFMGAPYVDMLEHTDGLRIACTPESIRYTDGQAFVPLSIHNNFASPFYGELRISITDAAQNRTLLSRRIPVTIRSLGSQRYTYTLPNRSGITISYTCKEAGSGLSVGNSQTLPYILTPAPSRKPELHTAAVVGVHPGHPFLFRIAASGKRPLTYAAAGLPATLTLDPVTGIIRGTLTPGDHHLRLYVSNALGATEKELTIAAGDELALTPPMGWNSWNCWGINVSAEKVKSSAQALLDKGLADYGWSYINIDDGWEAPQRAADSSILPNGKFGDIFALGQWLHAQGLRFGIYSSPGPRTCGGYPGSWHNEEKDAATYASWGIDYLKYDWCSYSDIAGPDTALLTYTRPYSLMQAALRRQNRDILYSLCQYGIKDVWTWGREVDAQSWRTTEDIEDTWASLAEIGFHQAPLYPYAGPGHWNDPDMMIVGQVGWGQGLHPSRLTPDEQYTHVSLWCMLSAPLLIGCDLSRLDAFTLNLLTNPEVLALDQDSLGHQARPLLTTDSCRIWVKELSGNARAVAVFNMTTTYRQPTIRWAALGIKTGTRLRDPWRRKDLGKTQDRYSVLIAPHGVQLLKIE